MTKGFYLNTAATWKPALAAAAMLLTTGLNAAAAEGDYIVVDGITYIVTSETGKTVQLTWDNDASEGDIVIPGEVTSPDNGQTYTVASVAYQAFAYNSNTSITLPGTIKAIGGEAFRSSFALAQITIPNSVETVGEMAFADCGELVSATLPDGTTTLQAGLFYNCPRLASITIGSSTTEIKDGAFTGCGSLATIYCKATTPPQMNANGAFPAQDFDNATLYVPLGCKTAYEATSDWDKFANIVERDFTTVGIADATATGCVAIYATNGTIMVNGADGSTVCVYSASGQCLYSGNATEISGLCRGIYIVKAGGSTAKVII